MKARKPRRKKDGSYELPMQCPTCGSPKLEVNSQSWKYHCWLCRSGGVVPDDRKSDLSQHFLSIRSESISPTPPTSTARELTKVLPLLAKQEISRRGFEEAWIVERYGVRWDGERLWWPAGDGASRRSVLPWETPKAITVSPRGLIGQHLLKDGCHIVITEGDWKSASIPLPWVGIGSLGVGLSREQAWTICTSNPTSVSILYDGGYEDEAMAAKEMLSPIQARVLKLPKDCGPDDIPRKDLISLLLG